MKYKLAFLIILSIFYLSCEDTKNDNPLTGTWSLLSMLNETYLTTNSNQNAIDQNSEGIGGITVSNGVNFNLTFLNREIDDDYQSFSVSNRSSPSCDLYISVTPSSIEASLLVQQNNDYIIYSEGVLDFTYDGLTLTVNPSTLYTANRTDSVQIVGSITSQTIPINANVPTVVESYDMPVGSTITLKLKSDGTYVWSFSQSIWNQIVKGDWVENGNVLTLTATESDGEETYWVEEYTFEINNDELILNGDESYCDDDPYWSVEECHTYYENRYGLDRGSLISIRDTAIIIFK